MAFSSLIEALGDELTDGANPHPDLGIHANLEILVTQLGSGRAAARFLGVAESTLRGWRRGVNPRGRSAEIFLAARNASLGTQWKAGYDGTGELAIKGRIRVSNDFRDRTIHHGRVIPIELMRRILTTWRRGSDARAEALLYGAIDRYYQPVEFIDIERAWFE